MGGGVSARFARLLLLHLHLVDLGRGAAVFEPVPSVLLELLHLRQGGAEVRECAMVRGRSFEPWLATEKSDGRELTPPLRGRRAPPLIAERPRVRKSFAVGRAGWTRGHSCRATESGGAQRLGVGRGRMGKRVKAHWRQTRGRVGCARSRVGGVGAREKRAKRAGERGTG